MRGLESRLIDKMGIPACILMENAGRAVADAVKEVAGKNKNIVCVCGTGNNAGDGFVAARHLINRGYKVKIFLTTSPDKLKGDAKINFDILEKMKVKVACLSSGKMVGFKKLLSRTGVVIDALFGIGLNRPLDDFYNTIIDAMNAAKRPIVAVDIPSGLDADTCKAWGSCVKAYTTVTFAYPKKGFMKNLGPKTTGQVVVAQIY